MPFSFGGPPTWKGPLEERGIGSLARRKLEAGDREQAKNIVRKRIEHELITACTENGLILSDENADSLIPKLKELPSLLRETLADIKVEYGARRAWILGGQKGKLFGQEDIAHYRTGMHMLADEIADLQERSHEERETQGAPSDAIQQAIKDAEDALQQKENALEARANLQAKRKGPLSINDGKKVRESDAVLAFVQSPEAERMHAALIRKQQIEILKSIAERIPEETKRIKQEIEELDTPVHKAARTLARGSVKTAQVIARESVKAGSVARVVAGKSKTLFERGVTLARERLTKTKQEAQWSRNFKTIVQEAYLTGEKQDIFDEAGRLVMRYGHQTDDTSLWDGLSILNDTYDTPQFEAFAKQYKVQHIVRALITDAEKRRRREAVKAISLSESNPLLFDQTRPDRD